MQKYLLTFLVKSDLKDEERKGILDSVTKKLEKIEKEDLWGVRSLTYPIQKQDRAFYAHYEFESEPASIPSLDKSIRLNEDILRYLLIKARDIKKSKKALKRAAAMKGTDKKEDIKETKEKEVKETVVAAV